jgi:hypothetical protein
MRATIGDGLLGKAGVVPTHYIFGCRRSVISRSGLAPEREFWLLSEGR